MFTLYVGHWSEYLSRLLSPVITQVTQLAEDRAKIWTRHSDSRDWAWTHYSTSTSSVQSSHSVVSNSLWPHELASLSITSSQRPPKPISIVLVMLSNYLILCCPLLLLPSIFPSIRVFSKWVSSLHQVAKVLEFQLQHQSLQWTPRTDLL